MTERSLSLLVIAVLCSVQLLAQEDGASGTGVQGMLTQALADSAVAAQPTAEDVEDATARMALHPDDLVASILPASPSPLQLAQADRFLDMRTADPQAPLDNGGHDAARSVLSDPHVAGLVTAALGWTTFLVEFVIDGEADPFGASARPSGFVHRRDTRTVSPR